MDGVAPSHEDGGSDYGSEFNFDDEVILNSLLEQTPDKRNIGPLLVLNDIEDHEGPKGARVPRVLGQKRRQYATELRLAKTGSQRRIPVEIEGHRSVSAPSESRTQRYGNAD